VLLSDSYSKDWAEVLLEIPVVACVPVVLVPVVSIAGASLLRRVLKVLVEEPQTTMLP